MNALPLSIGTVAKRAGCSVPTIRYYEDVGLMPPAARTEGGQRSYGEADVKRLRFIRRCRDFGFGVEHVRELLSLADEPDRQCVEVRDVAASRLADVRRRLAELTALETSLMAFVQDCDDGCAGGTTLDCCILEDLAEPMARPAITASRCCG